MKVHNLLVTGSLTSGGENITSISSSVSETISTVSSSISASINDLSASMEDMVTNMSSSFDTTMSTMATTGSNLFVGTQTISGSIIPAVDNTYDLGTATQQFRDLYLSSASLYIDGTKVLGSTSQELQITTDVGQSFKILEDGSDTITLQSGDGNITLASSGGGDVILDPTNGIVALKGTTTVYAGNRILSSDGNNIHFGVGVTMTGSLTVSGYIETQELRTTYISSSILYRSGSTKFGDELSDTHDFTGSLNISGSVNAIGSGLVSGSSQISYSGLSGIPSGIISGSSQLPSGLVSGSVQVDVMSTTNIAQLATTGSNSFTGTQSFGYGKLVATGHNSSAQITINATYDGGQSNTYTPDYSGDSSAGMFVMKQSNGGYGDFHFYGKNHQTTGGSHDLSSFNQIMGMNTSGRVAIGKLYANETLDVNGNTLVSGSITSTANVAAGTTISWNGGVGALSYGGGTVTMETNSATPILLKTNGATAITISTGQTVTFASSISTGGSVSAIGNVSITKEGSNDIGVGPYVAIAQPTQSKQWVFQLNGSAGLDYWHYNGSAWSVPFKVGTTGAVGINSYTSTIPLEIKRFAGSGGTLRLIGNDTVVGMPSISFLNDNGNGGASIAMTASNQLNLNGTAYVNPSGNMGINTNNPTQKLEIANGNLRLTEIGTSSFDISYSGGKVQFGMDSAGADGFYFRSYSGGYADRFIIKSNGDVDIRGTVRPLIDATYDLGSTSLRWNNLYTTDLHLSNEGKQNVVDGTWGDWTLQEGEHDIFMLNNRSGEKFKIKLEKIID